MPGAPDPEPRAVLAGDAGPWILKRLLGYAFRRTQNLARAQDLAQQAVLLTLEGRGWHRWMPDADEAPERSLLGHLCDLARSTGKDQNKSAAVRRHAPPDPNDPERDARVADPATAEQARMDEGEHRAWVRLAERVMESLDPQARALLALEEQSVRDAAEQARRVGCTVPQVYAARKRIGRARDAALAEHGDPGHKGGPT